MKKSNTLILSIGLALFMACGAPEATHEHTESHPEVQLDNGKKWKANPETIIHLNNMSEMIMTFGELKTETEYRMLGVELSNELKLVFEECTMEGEAHEQLHNYLIPLHHKIEALAKGEAEAPAQEVEEIQIHLSEFGEYFE